MPALPVDRIRFTGETRAAAACRADPFMAAALVRVEASGPPDVARLKRTLLARSIQLTDGMAPDAWAAARRAASALSVEGVLEIYQAAGAENAAIHLIGDPILLEIRGRLLSLIDDDAATAVFGHELGHFLAHGPQSTDGLLGMVAGGILGDAFGIPSSAKQVASHLAMCRELTADRFGLLACGSLDAALRLEMAGTTGLSVTELTWDTDAYLAQCTALIEQLERDGGAVSGTTHPEHGLRAWALALWAGSDRYAELTGGTGGAPIDEIDERIDRVLSAAPSGSLLDTPFDDAPIPEVMECALACAVLVALCDGEMVEAESVAIESLFATHVHDWQRYLNWDNALEAFADTGAVVIHGGASVQRSVFQVLMQVVTADKVVADSEIEMVCALGDALRCGVLFRALLTPVLVQMGIEVPDLDNVERTIPMPARADEAREAFDLFLRGIVRRGGGDVTVRRMARLLGDATAHDATRTHIAERMTIVGLVCDIDIAHAKLDRLVHVDLTDATRRAQSDTTHLPDDSANEPVRKRLTAAFTRLRDQLVNGDGRSPSIRLRNCRTGRSFDLFRLEGVSVGHAERVLAAIREQAPARIIDGSEVGVHEGAEKVATELIRLEREARGRTEQTGARDLYVGAPFLTGVFGGYLVRAPLVLYAVDIERSRGRGFRLIPRENDPPVANQALLRLLFSKKDLPFPDTLAAELDAAAETGLDAVRELLSTNGIVARPESDTLTSLKPRDEDFTMWSSGRAVIERCAVLGFFPQSSSDMIQDYDGLLQAIADPNEPLAERFGAAGALLPADLRAALHVTDELKSPDGPLIPVVLADPSQLGVLQQARTQRTLVVDGPPGTGKSQVIVNLVADALSRGQTVAVVCEKRAAIDVVAQRLEQIGFRHLLALVHDVQDDRRALYNQVLTRLGDGHYRDADADKATRTTEDLAAVHDALHSRRAALATALGDETPTVGQLHLLATSYLTDALQPMSATVARLSLRDLRRLAERVSRENRNADLFAAESVWRAPSDTPRPSLAEATPEELSDVETSLMAARDTAKALDAVRQDCDDRAIVRARPAVDRAIATRPSRARAGIAKALVAMLAVDDADSLQALMADLQTAWTEPERWLPAVPERVRFDVPPDFASIMAVIRKAGSSFFRYFSPAWWSARGRLKTLLATQWPAAMGASTTPALAEQVAHRRTASDAYVRLDAVLGALALSPILANSEAARQQATALHAAWEIVRDLDNDRTLLTDSDAWPGADLATWDAQLDQAIVIAEASQAHAVLVAPLREWLPYIQPTPNADLTETLVEAWSLDASRVVLSDRNLDAACALHPDARVMTHQLADGGLVAEEEWREAIESGWVAVMLTATERRHPGIRELNRQTPFGAVRDAEERLRELQNLRAQAHIDAMLERCDRAELLTEARPDKGKRRTPVQKAREQMLREASKKRYVLSLRGFVRQFVNDGLMDILPVWLVSPETMAILFPGRPIFDLIVMDEASQATVEKGLPALIRGHRAVVAGDERQMPPSSYFQLATPGDDDEVGTAETVEADVLTAESLLVLARERCAHRGLRWHYRCLHEELIAFSNHAMYGGELFTIPSTHTPHATPAVRWVSVDGGVYDKGVNPIEAERVAELTHELLRQTPPPSIGIITLNVQQRRLILDTLDQRAETDDDFAERWATAKSHETLDQRPFVKNLEGVQGDERDVIVFSLGHAPSKRRSGPLAGTEYVAARFGPLGQEGGERRLNVAVSRAKRECIVVSSFAPNLLSVANTKNEGPKLFKAFLEYTWDMTHGRRRAADKTLERVRHGSLGAVRRERPVDFGVPSLAAQIGLRLANESIGYDLNVGNSGFRVPLALRDPDDNTQWRVAVLTEEGHTTGDVDQAHRHEPGVLRARSWKVVRVSTREWHTEPDTVLKMLKDALQRACDEAVAESQRQARAALGYAVNTAPSDEASDATQGDS
jgi:hypothetical protein